MERYIPLIKLIAFYYFGMFFINYSLTSWFAPLIHKDSSYLQEIQYPELITMSIAFGLIIPTTVFVLMHYNKKINDYFNAVIIGLVATCILSLFSFLLLNTFSELFIMFFSKPKLIYSIQYIPTSIVFVVTVKDFLNRINLNKADDIICKIAISLFICYILMLIFDENGNILNKLSMSFTYVSMGAILLTKMRS